MCEAYSYEKCARKMLMKITTGVIFMQHFTCTFLSKKFCAAFLYLKFGFVFFWKNNIGAKVAPKIVGEIDYSSATYSGVRAFSII